MIDHKSDYEAGKLSTTDGQPPVHFGAPAPNPETDPVTHQHKSYWVLSEAERAKGFVRPVRSSYRHEKCGSVTTMGRAFAEAYARQPDFYGAAMCYTCSAHYPVGAGGEFTWMDNGRDTGEKVGT